MTFNKNLWILILVIICSSCKSKKELWYFQDLQNNQQRQLKYETSKIQYNDILTIQLSALNPESILPYKFDNSISTNSSFIETLKLQGYLVDQEGTIVFPILGRIEVAGKSTKELEAHIKSLLEDGGHVKNPSVSVRILNSKITILGEVHKPGTYTITEQNITLPQALGYAGDLTINGERTNVTLIRDEGGVQTVKRIDLTKSDWFDTPYYFIKQNDVIVVYPNDAKVKSAGFIGNTGTLLGIASLILSTVVIITR